MGKCENCIHYDACKKISDVHGLAFGSSPFCDLYKSKSLFVELPCKVGDKVYVDEDTWSFGVLYYDNKFIHSKFFAVGEIVSVIKTKKQLLMKIRVSNSIHTRYRHKRYPVSAIGKTVFLTKEEAEKKLKEVQK